MLRLREFVPEGHFYHTARAFCSPGQRARLHGQDFAEVFWIEAGSGTHLINDRRIALERGDVVLMRSRDRHGITARGDGDLMFINIAFSTTRLTALRRRYFQGDAWPWAGGALPASIRLSASRINQLNRYAEELDGQGQSLRALDRFLLNLMTLIETHGVATGEAGGDLPGWLVSGIARFAANRDAIVVGMPMLAKLCIKSREHVSRSVRTHLGQTPTELITSMRLDLAESDLRLSDKPIIVVAFDCGMPNLANFYLRFKQRFGVTPRRYRMGTRSFLG